jgi:hypothetical protein
MMESCLEKIEGNQGKIEIKMEACLEEMKVDTNRALEDQSGTSVQSWDAGTH